MSAAKKKPAPEPAAAEVDDVPAAAVSGAEALALRFLEALGVLTDDVKEKARRLIEREPLTEIQVDRAVHLLEDAISEAKWREFLAVAWVGLTKTFQEGHGPTDHADSDLA